VEGQKRGDSEGHRAYHYARQGHSPLRKVASEFHFYKYLKLILFVVYYIMCLTLQVRGRSAIEYGGRESGC